MLTRNGEPIEHSKRKELTSGEMDSFNEAYGVIREDLASLQRVKESVRELAKNAATFTIPQGGTADGIIEIPNKPVDRWQIRSALLKLNNSEILLCDRTVGGLKEFSVIQRLHAASPYGHLLARFKLACGHRPEHLKPTPSWKGVCGPWSPARTKKSEPLLTGLGPGSDDLCQTMNEDMRFWGH